MFKTIYYNPHKKLHRQRTSPFQLKQLEDFFNVNSKPTKVDLQWLAQRTEMYLRSIKVWFQNRRAKKRQTMPSKSIQAWKPEFAKLPLIIRHNSLDNQQSKAIVCSSPLFSIGVLINHTTNFDSSSLRHSDDTYSL